MKVGDSEYAAMQWEKSKRMAKMLDQAKFGNQRVEHSGENMTERVNWDMSHDNEWQTISWVPAYRKVPRKGIFGWLLDWILGCQMEAVPGGGRFYALRADGSGVTTDDGVTWKLPTSK